MWSKSSQFSALQKILCFLSQSIFVLSISPKFVTEAVDLEDIFYESSKYLAQFCRDSMIAYILADG